MTLTPTSAKGVVSGITAGSFITVGGTARTPSVAVANYPSDATLFARGDGTWAAPASSGTVQPATTISGAGGAVSGKNVILRVDVSPYDFITLVYDATLGKYISHDTGIVFLSAGSAVTSTSVSYAELGQPNLGRQVVPFHTALYNAGLRLQVWYMFYGWNSIGANTTYMALYLSEFNNGDTAQSADIGNTADLTVTGTTTGKFNSSGWVDITYTSAPTLTHAWIKAYGKVSAGTGTWTRMIGRYRWVATP